MKYLLVLCVCGLFLIVLMRMLRKSSRKNVRTIDALNGSVVHAKDDIKSWYHEPSAGYPLGYVAVPKGNEGVIMDARILPERGLWLSVAWTVKQSTIFLGVSATEVVETFSM